MSATMDTGGNELGEDKSKKGRFTVKFAIGRRPSEDPEMAISPAVQQLPSSPNGKRSLTSLHITGGCIAVVETDKRA